jgi:hypothetical protein
VNVRALHPVHMCISFYKCNSNSFSCSDPTERYQATLGLCNALCANSYGARKAVGNIAVLFGTWAADATVPADVRTHMVNAWRAVRSHQPPAEWAELQMRLSGGSESTIQHLVSLLGSVDAL